MLLFLLLFLKKFQKKNSVLHAVCSTYYYFYFFTISFPEDAHIRGVFPVHCIKTVYRTFLSKLKFESKIVDPVYVEIIYRFTLFNLTGFLHVFFSEVLYQIFPGANAEGCFQIQPFQKLAVANQIKIYITLGV
jgi:hypothetical protein